MSACADCIQSPCHRALLSWNLHHRETLHGSLTESHMTSKKTEILYAVLLFMTFNALPLNIFLAMSECEGITDDKSYVTQKMNFVFK